MARTPKPIRKRRKHGNLLVHALDNHFTFHGPGYSGWTNNKRVKNIKQALKWARKAGGRVELCRRDFRTNKETVWIGRF